MALSNLKRSAIILGSLAAVVLLGGYVAPAEAPTRRSPARNRTQERAALTVTATILRNENVARTVTATGGIHAWQEVIIGPEVAVTAWPRSWWTWATR